MVQYTRQKRLYATGFILLLLMASPGTSLGPKAARNICAAKATRTVPLQTAGEFCRLKWT